MKPTVADTLFLKLDDAELTWLMLDSLGEVRHEGSGDAEAFREAHDPTEFDGRVIVIVPGESVLLTSANVPSKQYRQIIQAVPYVVEEQLAMDVEACFFALGKRGTGEVEVAVVTRAILTGWLQQLGELGIETSTIISETSLLPSSRGTCIVIDNERVHLRWGSGKGLTTNKEDLSLAVSLIREDIGTINLYVQPAERESIDIQVSELTAAK